MRDTPSRETGIVAVATRIVQEGYKIIVYFTMWVDDKDKRKPN